MLLPARNLHRWQSQIRKAGSPDAGSAVNPAIGLARPQSSALRRTTRDLPDPRRASRHHPLYRAGLTAALYERAIRSENAPRTERPVSIAIATVSKVLTTLAQPSKGRPHWIAYSIARESAADPCGMAALSEADRAGETAGTNASPNYGQPRDA
jgi:hypothetical protein